MSFHEILFYLMAAVLLYSGLRVVLARHPVVAALHLILGFFNAAMLWILIGAEFLGLLLIVVYVGAVMVLFLFVVMMIDVVPESQRRDFRTFLPLGLVVGGVMVAEFAMVFWPLRTVAVAGSQPEDYNNTLALGIAMYSQYGFAVQIGALILLVGMVAAIALTLRARKNRKYVLASEQLYVNPKDRVRLLDLKKPATTDQETAQ